MEDVSLIAGMEGWTRDELRQYLLDELELGVVVAEELGPWRRQSWPIPDDFTLLAPQTWRTETDRSKRSTPCEH